MKIVAISDMHGQINNLYLPEGDVLLIAGDICPATNHSVSFQETWYLNTFIPWLQKQPFNFKIFVAGNHDFYFENTSIDKIKSPLPPDCIYLMDESVTIDGIKFYGTPWQPWFYDWAFNLYENDLAIKFNKMPNDVDVIISHGPPFGFGNVDCVLARNDYTGVGSTSLTEAIYRIRPILNVCGHIHSGSHIPYKYIHDNEKETIVANVSVLNERYKLEYPPAIFVINKETRKIEG